MPTIPAKKIRYYLTEAIADIASDNGYSLHLSDSPSIWAEAANDLLPLIDHELYEHISAEDKRNGILFARVLNEAVRNGLSSWDDKVSF